MIPPIRPQLEPANHTPYISPREHASGRNYTLHARKLYGAIGDMLEQGEFNQLLKLSPNRVAKAQAALSKATSLDSAMALAKIGRAAKGWYSSAAKTLKHLFGEDAPRFVAVLASSSPSKGVRKNVQQATWIWSQYEKLREDLGHTPTRNELIPWMHKLNKFVWTQPDLLYMRGSLNLGKGSDSGNILKSLDPANDPGDMVNKVLSTPESHKVDNFRKNLLGNLMAITNDTWVARIFHTGKSAPAKAEYHLSSAQVRQVTQEINKGLPADKQWTPADTQAAIWQGYRQIALIRSFSKRDPFWKEEWSRSHNDLPLPKKEVDSDKAAKFVTHGHITKGANMVNLIHEDPISKKNLGSRLDNPLPEEQSELNPEESVMSGLSKAERKALKPLISRAGKQYIPPGVHESKKGNKRRFADQGQRVSDGSQAPPPMPSTIAGNTPGPQQTPQPGQTPASAVAASPNVQEGLSYEQASTRAKSGNQSAFKKIMEGMLTNLGIKGKTTDAVGDWVDGAENSLYQHIDHPVDPGKVEYAAAWYGLLANQKSVLVFHAQPQGKDSLYSITFPENNLEMKDVSKVRQMLDKFGISFRTIIPGKKGVTVTYYDQDRKDREKVLNFVGATHGSISESSGQGKYIGGSTRTGARAEYRKLIDSYEAGKTPGSSGGADQEERKALLGNYGSTAASRKAPSGGQYAFSKRGSKVRFNKLRSWIDENGNIHEVPGDETHYTWANRVLKKDWKQMHGEGWGRIAKYGKQLFYANPFSAPNHKQLSALKDLATENGIDEVLHDREDQNSDPRTIWSNSEQFSKRGTRVKFSGVQSPQGGVIVRGLFYPGGKYIPKEELEKSKWNQYEEVSKRRNTLYNQPKQMSRRQDGSIESAEKLKYAKPVSAVPIPKAQLGGTGGPVLSDKHLLGVPPVASNKPPQAIPTGQSKITAPRAIPIGKQGHVGQMVPLLHGEDASVPKHEDFELEARKHSAGVHYSRRADGSVPMSVDPPKSGKEVHSERKKSVKDSEEPHEIKSLAELVYTMMADSVTLPNGKTKKIKPLHYAKGSWWERLGEPDPNKSLPPDQGQLEEEQDRKKTATSLGMGKRDAVGRELKSPAPTRKPLLPYGGYQPPQEGDIEGQEGQLEGTPWMREQVADPKKPVPHAITSPRQGNTFGIYQDFIDENQGKLHKHNVQQTAGQLLWDSMIDEGSWQANPDLWKHVNHNLQSLSRHHIAMLPSPNKVPKKDLARLHNQWWIAHRMEEYLNTIPSHPHLYNLSHGTDHIHDYVKMHRAWEDKEAALSSLVHYYGTGRMPGIDMLDPENQKVVAANKHFADLRNLPEHGVNNGLEMRDQREQSLNALRKLGLPV